MSAIFTNMTILAALLVMGCAAIEGELPALDTAATKAAQTGGCVKLRCEYAPLRCRPAVARCERGW